MTPISHLNKSDLEKIVTHLLSLDKDSRRLRFGMEIEDKGVRSYVSKIHWNEDGVYGIYNDSLALVGFTHAARCNDMVEFGVSVLNEYRGCGYGTELFNKAVLFARNHFIHKMFMHCLRENTPMQKIARKNGMKLITECGEVDAYLEMSPMDQASLTKDLLQEELGSFDLAVKKSVNSFDYVSKGLTSVFSTYVSAFKPKSNDDKVGNVDKVDKKYLESLTESKNSDDKKTTEL